MADLTVMTWNIQNLFPAGHADGPGYTCNGREGETGIDSYGNRPIDPAFFAQVAVEHGTVVWPNGVDLDPLVLHGDFEPAESQSRQQVV